MTGGVAVLNETAKRGQPYDITLDGRSYAPQTAQVNTGFGVESGGCGVDGTEFGALIE